MERQQRTFSDDLYATLSTAGADDASVRPSVPARLLSSSRAAPPMSAVPLAPGRPAPAGGASTAAPAGGAGGGAPVDTLAGTGVPAPTPRASLADMMRDVAYAGMKSVANVNICLKIVGVTPLSPALPEQGEGGRVRASPTVWLHRH
jgi:hypothetical protein